jgi:uncharacterized membrane protein
LGQDNSSRPVLRADAEEEQRAPIPGEGGTAERASSKEAARFVEVLPDVLNLLTAADFAPEVPEKTRQRRRLNKVVQIMIVAGLALSTAAMSTGLALCLVSKTPLPTETLPLGRILAGIGNLSPPAFLSLGLLLLIGTPVLSVLGTVIMFACTREWRYVLLSLLVLAILSVGIAAGGG